MVSKQTQEWIKNVVSGLNENVDKKTCAEILEACGRGCTPKELIEKARGIYERSRDIGEFHARFPTVFEALQIEDDAVYVVYPSTSANRSREYRSNSCPMSTATAPLAGSRNCSKERSGARWKWNAYNRLSPAARSAGSRSSCSWLLRRRTRTG